MACRCSERREALKAARGPAETAQAVGFAARTIVEDVSQVSADGLKRVNDYLMRRGIWPRSKS